MELSQQAFGLHQLQQQPGDPLRFFEEPEKDEGISELQRKAAMGLEVCGVI
jgi:hypothetical protein